MMPAFAMAATALLGVASPTEAEAQGQTVLRADAVAEFGSCVIRQAPSLSRALMATELGSREEQNRARQLAEGRGACLDGRHDFLTTRTGEIRGTVAEALIESDPRVVDALTRLPARSAERASPAEGREFVIGFSRCLADADAPKAMALLQSAHRSDEERAAFLDFGDTLNDCMPHGVAYRIDRFDVRNHIAIRLYELAQQMPSTLAQGEVR